MARQRARAPALPVMASPCLRETTFWAKPMKDYHVNIFFSQDDEGYIADIPDLAMCSAFGRTPAEALAEVETAKQVWLEAARAEGKPIPEPTYRPVIYQLAS